MLRGAIETFIGTGFVLLTGWVLWTVNDNGKQFVALNQRLATIESVVLVKQGARCNCNR